MDIEPIVLLGDESEVIRYPADTIWLRAAGHGDLQVAEYVSEDRDGPPAHTHPWDEAQIVISGEVEFRVGHGSWVAAGPGSVQLLPHGIAHSVRVPQGTARLVQVSVGAPYDAFARDMARLFARDAPLAEIAEVAAHHGVRLA